MRNKTLIRALSFCLAAMLLALLPALAEDIATPLDLPAPEGGTLMTLIPEDLKLGPREEGYTFTEGMKTAASYADPSITVNIGRGRIYETDYIYARVKIAHASQLRTLMASSLSSERTALGTTLAKSVKAVVAINGDFCAKQVRGTVIREGKTLRLRCNGEVDVLVIDDAGDLHILENAADADVQAFGEHAVHAFTFGPGLIIDGKPKYGYNNRAMATHRVAQRMAICQTGPLEYLLITSEGPEDPGSTGLFMDQFVELLASFPDIQNAYNLDGGSCATLVFRKGDSCWAKINCPRNGKSRSLKDMIYFADAWVPDPAPEGETGGQE